MNPRRLPSRSNRGHPSRRCGGRSPDNQLRRGKTKHRRQVRDCNPLEEKLGRRRPHGGMADMNGRQRRIDHINKRHVIVSYDRDVSRTCQVTPLRLAIGTQRQEIVGGRDRCQLWMAIQQSGRGNLACLLAAIDQCRLHGADFKARSGHDGPVSGGVRWPVDKLAGPAMCPILR